MSKVRVYEVAKQLNLEPKAVVTLFQTIGVADVRNHMSSVDPDAVERIKKHLQKKETHDVVEERIRPTVVKRRAVAKPAAESTQNLGGNQAPSAQASAPALPSTRNLASTPRLPSPLPSAPAAASPSGRGSSTGGGSAGLGLVASSVAAASARALPDAPSSASPVAAAPRSAKRLDGSSSDVAAAASTHSLNETASATGTLSASASSSPSEAGDARAPERGSSATARKSNGNVPAARASSPKILPAVPSAEDFVGDASTDFGSRAASASNETFTTSTAVPSDVKDAPAATTFAEHMQGTPIAAAVPEPARPSPVTAPRTESVAPPATRSMPPKTGVEYWTGRPGVPMPAPGTMQRPGTGGGPMPRRAVYDPRAGASAAARGPVRPGMQQTGRPMMRGPGGMMMGRGRMQSMPRGPRQVTTKEMSDHKKVIRIEDNVTLSSMANKMSMKATELLMKLLSMGMTNVHINTSLDADTAKLLADEFGWEVEDVAISEEASIAAARGEESGIAKEVVRDENSVLRAPVVTVMGHVDHGKTSLLDKIRKANVASGEAGGITQHIGAYKVQTANGTIVFLDTPGHEAFTAMRARGAGVTDIVVLVVAADDGVMPQTKEAVAHAKSAGVPIIVAVNKIDKPGADPERARRELVELGLQPEDWGGDTIFVNVSAHTGAGIPQLLEMLALQAEILDLKANPKKAASGTVIEALLDRGRGPVARILVQEGTLKVGDFVLAGQGFGKVRAMLNELGKPVHEAGPSTPVEILGLSDVPNAGDLIYAVKDAKKALEIADGRRARPRMGSDVKISLEELSKRIQNSGQQELRLIVKGDVQGSVEAVSDALRKLSGEKVRLTVIHAGVGAITEGDVNLAIAGKAVIVGFNVRPAGKAGALADENKIEIRQYSIIYQAVDEVRNAMEGLLPSQYIEKVLGRAELRQLFKIRGVAVAGSMVTQGVIKRGGNIRIIRDNIVVHSGKLGDLKRFKEDVKEVAEGFECGISLDDYSDLKEKDVLEYYEMEEVKQKL